MYIYQLDQSMDYAVKNILLKHQLVVCSRLMPCYFIIFKQYKQHIMLYSIAQEDILLFQPNYLKSHFPVS